MTAGTIVQAGVTTRAASPFDALLLRYQQGDAEAARLLIRQASPILFRTVYPFVNDSSAAEDVLQEVWLRIHSSRHTWRAGEPALPWMLAVARYTRIDYLRRAGRRRETDIAGLPAEPAAPSPRPDAEIETLLRDLPESQREVLLLLKVEGLSLEETARATGSTIGAVKQKASRAYAKLRSIFRSKP